MMLQRIGAAAILILFTFVITQISYDGKSVEHTRNTTTVVVRINTPIVRSTPKKVSNKLLIDEKSSIVQQFANEYMEFSRSAISSAVPFDVTNTTVLSWNGVIGMNSILSHSWQQSLFCNKINETRYKSSDPNLPIIVNFTVSCMNLYLKSVAGTGNFIILLYGIRLAAYVYGNIDVYFTCTDADTTKTELLLPWLHGWYPARKFDNKSPIPITIHDVCTKFSHIPLQYMYKQIQYDFHTMTTELVGIPQITNDPTGFSFFGQSTVVNFVKTPLLANSSKLIKDLDEAVIHFRCGDLMDSKHEGFGFMTFHGYTKYIPSNVNSIGIITQPFDTINNNNQSSTIQNRKVDMASHKRERCRVVVTSFMEYIQEQFPNVSVRIRNNIGETITVAFVRMMLAKTMIVGMSTFGALASLATIGTAYVRVPHNNTKGPNHWLIRPTRMDYVVDKVVLFDDLNIILVSDMKQLWETKGHTGVLEWFWNGTK